MTDDLSEAAAIIEQLKEGRGQLTDSGPLQQVLDAFEKGDLGQTFRACGKFLHFVNRQQDLKRDFAKPIAPDLLTEADGEAALGRLSEIVELQNLQHYEALARRLFNLLYPTCAGR